MQTYQRIEALYPPDDAVEKSMIFVLNQQHHLMNQEVTHRGHSYDTNCQSSVNRSSSSSIEVKVDSQKHPTRINMVISFKLTTHYVNMKNVSQQTLILWLSFSCNLTKKCKTGQLINEYFLFVKHTKSLCSTP